MQKKYIWGIVGLIIIGGGYYWYAKSHATPTAVQYVTTAAQKGTLITAVSGSGNIIVDQQSNIDPTITGAVSGLAVAVGDQVKQGQLLFNIVNDQLGVSAAKSVASLKQSKDAIDSAEVNKKSAEADYDAAKKKNKTTSGTYTHDQLDVLQSKIDTADNGIAEAEKNYAAALLDYQNQQTTAGKRKVVASIAGTVNAVNIKNGDDLSKLSSGSSRQVPIIIGDLGTLKAQVQVNEVDIPNVSLEQKVMMTFGAIDGLTISGKIEKMDALGTITQGVVTYNVTIGFDTVDPRIRPEMSVSAKIITNVLQDVITVPNSALKTQGNRTYVEVLPSGAKTPEMRTNIEIGAANNTDTQIVSGINVGDNVVTQTIDPNAKATTPAAGGGARLPGFGGGRG